jgi:hypothetical protein
VRIRARVCCVLRLRDPFAGAEAAVTGAALRHEGDLLTGDLAAGQEVALCLPGEAGDL